MTGRNLARRLARFESGERVTASVFRGDELLEVGIVLKAAPLDTCYLRRARPSRSESRRAASGVARRVTAPYHCGELQLIPREGSA